MSNYTANKQNNAAYYFIDRHLNSNVENKKAFVEAIPNGRSISYKDLSIETNKIIDLLTKYSGVKNQPQLFFSSTYNGRFSLGGVHKLG